MAVCLSGCGLAEGDAASSPPELPEWLTEEGGKDSSGTSDSMPDFGAPAATLALNLKVGDRFPLRKVVDQQLTQSSLSGAPQVNRARLELMFAITVAAVDEGRTKLGVRYERVRYMHDVAGEHVEYDSTYPPTPVPIGVRAYHDMVGDGFSFWLGADNQIAAVEGFKEFVERCLRNIPAEKRTEVLLGIEAGSGETGFANFVDNSIGLLPYGEEQSPGDSWERTSHVQRPVPMHINTRYTLKEVTDSIAIIDIHGSITPSTTAATVDNGNGVRVTVTGGDTRGTCTIFRDTGLPKQSRVERTVNMSVQVSETSRFNQQKTIVTTIDAFPASPASSPTIIGLND